MQDLIRKAFECDTILTVCMHDREVVADGLLEKSVWTACMTKWWKGLKRRQPPQTLVKIASLRHLDSSVTVHHPRAIFRIFRLSTDTGIFRPGPSLVLILSWPRIQPRPSFEMMSCRGRSRFSCDCPQFL